jgi:hypothetical protein
MIVQVADMRTHVQRPVSVVKMATVLEDCTTKEQRSAVPFFCGQKDSMQRLLIKKRFLLTGGSVCCVKRVHDWVANVSLMTERLKRRCGSD